MENNTPEKGKMGGRRSLTGRITVLLAVLSTAIALKSKDDAAHDRQYGKTNVTRVMVSGPCRLVP